MKYNTLKIGHYQALIKEQYSFAEGLNILLGPNESGKSSIIACLMATVVDFDKQQRAHFALSTANEWRFSVQLSDDQLCEVKRKLLKTANQSVVSRGQCNDRKLSHYPLEDHLQFIVDSALWHIKPISHHDFAIFASDDLWQNWLIQSQLPSGSQHPQAVIEQLSSQLRELYTKHAHSKSAIAAEDRHLKTLYEQKRQLMAQRDDKLADFNTLFSKRAEIDRLSAQRQQLISQRSCVQRDTPLYQILLQRDECQQYITENDSANKRKQCHFDDYQAADVAYHKAHSALALLEQQWQDSVAKATDYHHRLNHQPSINDDNQHQARQQQLEHYLATQQQYDQQKRQKQRSLFTFIALSCLVLGMSAAAISAWYLKALPSAKWPIIGFIALVTTTLASWLFSLVRWRILADDDKRLKSTLNQYVTTDLAWAKLPLAGESSASQRALSVEQARLENDRQRDYCRHIAQQNNLSAALDQAKRELASCHVKRDHARQTLRDIYGEQPLEQIRSIANHHQLIWQQLASLELQLAPHRSRIAQIMAVADMPSDAQLDEDITEIDTRLNRLRGQLAQLESMLDTHPDDQLELINCEIDEVLHKRRQLMQQYDEKLLVQAVVKRVYQRLNAVNQPGFINLAKRLLHQLSAGFIKGISLSADKRVLLDEGLNDGQLYSDQLSYGAANLINFALRIAILEHYDPQGNLPLFIDDAISAFDLERQRAAIALIVQLAKRRQIFFTATTLKHLEALDKSSSQIIRLTRKNSD